MTSSCDLCEKEYDRRVADGSGKVLHELLRGDIWACGDCIAAPALAAKYKKALEEIREKLVLYLNCFHCCDCDLRWAGKDWRVCAHPGEECSFKEMRECVFSAEAALKEGR